MLTPEVGVEVWFRYPPLIPLVPLSPRALPILRLPLWSSLLVPVFFPFLLLSHVLPLLRLLHAAFILLLFRMLHLAFVLLLFRMPVPTLRLLLRPSLVLRSHLMPISALRFLIVPVVRPRLILAIVWLRRLLPIIAVLVLRYGNRRQSQQQRSTNRAHD
jgi:hypothetical protein